MNRFEKIKAMDINEFAKWLSNVDEEVYINWFDTRYCKNCEPVFVDSNGRIMECTYCEVNDECRFYDFGDVGYPIPTTEHIVKAWLEAEEDE